MTKIIGGLDCWPHWIRTSNDDFIQAGRLFTFLEFDEFLLGYDGA